MIEHEHDWVSVGKRWAVCRVKGCPKVKTVLYAEFTRIGTLATSASKSVEIITNGRIVAEFGQGEEVKL